MFSPTHLTCYQTKKPPVEDRTGELGSDDDEEKNKKKRERKAAATKVAA